ncbi:hypothetical protein [Microbacterium sp. C7(2022)]|uniref:hypothetical protein n=1 Tax=Microbacterium sp. C7(2022) TaxID=2992759 RepID=UPI00237B86E0|nr:hypothetical protein [Microbacterium sp. C7(2022)]MDE0546234.1 hypothetical protein [Microbacterium sp. C7(2022)]
MTDTDVVSPASGEPDLDADVIHGSVDVEGMPREYTAVVPHAPNVCEWSGVAVPTMVVLGTADPISPFEGGQAGSFAGKLGEVMAAEDSAAFLAERSGASGEPEVGE